jgi:hypothetical protein
MNFIRLFFLREKRPWLMSCFIYSTFPLSCIRVTGIISKWHNDGIHYTLGRV